MGDLEILSQSISRLDRWITENDWKAYDPFDGLNARVFNTLTGNNHYLRIVLQQSVRRFPFNLRPLLGIRKETSSKGMGFCALGYLKLYQATRKEEYHKKMEHCLEWLKNNFSEGHSGYAWGNHFNYESRGGRISLGTPSIVWTALIGDVFFDAYETTGKQLYADIATSSGKFVMNDICRFRESEDTLCLMYTPLAQPSAQRCIHNANVLGARLLSRFHQHTSDSEALAVAKKAIEYTLKYQLPDGGWYYGEPSKFQWVDSFHTGYNLEAIQGYKRATGDQTCEAKLVKGFRYFKSVFFKEDGTPKYYNRKTYPIDIQCAAQGIQTLVNLREYDPGALELAKKVALWTINNMQDPQGYFYFRKYPFVTNTTPMFHWGQATMLAALASLIQAYVLQTPL
jgi:hypothetical protein